MSNRIWRGGWQRPPLYPMTVTLICTEDTAEHKAGETVSGCRSGEAVTLLATGCYRLEGKTALNRADFATVTKGA